ncbi:MAG TPA: hypothetical protein VGD66_11640 [Allosphingosinicella sp.]|jgi:hypothetical protein
MFIEKIDLAAATPLRSRPKALKLGVGLAVALVCAVAMVPWTLFVALWAAVAAVAAATAKAARILHASLLYAGEAVVGR